MALDLKTFTLRDMTECGAALRRMGNEGSMSAVAERVVRYFYDQLLEAGTGERQCVLVRFFRTQPYSQLSPELQRFADGLSAGVPNLPATKCMVLLASAGLLAAWNDPLQSEGHLAIPLGSAEMVERLPMIASLIRQFGLEIPQALDPDPQFVLDLEQRLYNVFHVPEAVGSPVVPAQAEFVVRYGVRSVLGCGGMLPSGELFAVILFLRTRIPLATAHRFRTLALSIKLALLPFDEDNWTPDEEALA
jgi:hypothetical protein